MNKDKLLKDLKDKKYRRAFVSKLIDNAIPFQIKAMREQRKMSQEELAKLCDKKQTAISRLENPDYAKFTLKTLKELADAFDVGLIVRFAPIGELVKWELNLSPEALEVSSYEKDPYFKERAQEPEVDTKLLRQIQEGFFYRPFNEPKASMSGIENAFNPQPNKTEQELYPIGAI